MSVLSTLQRPPFDIPFFTARGEIDDRWQRFLLAIQKAITTNAAPSDAQYWLSTANGDLTAERNIGALAAGYLKIAVALGIATPSSVAVIPTADGGTGVNIAAAALPLGSGQIQFPAAQNPAAGVNVLDDYEEGTWTPADNSAAALVLTVTSALYVKVGQMVHVSCDVTYPVTVSGLGATLKGLPFTSAAGKGGLAYGKNTSGVAQTAQVDASAQTITFLTLAGAAVTNTQESAAQLVLAGTYRASA